MNVSLTKELEKFVNQEVSGGLYGSASEVVREALRLLKERETRLNILRKELAIGIEQADRGEWAPFHLKEFLSEARRRSSKPRHKK